jgi:hypothetical protein
MSYYRVRHPSDDDDVYLDRNNKQGVLKNQYSTNET